MKGKEATQIVLDEAAQVVAGTRAALWGGRTVRRVGGDILFGRSITAIYLEPRLDPEAAKARNLEAARIAQEVKDPTERARLLFNLKNA